MEKEIQISIIIPTYNVEVYLKECLDSIVNQTFKRFEIICVDDGSDDNTLNILNAYAQKHLNIKVITQTNQFAGVARNNGMKYASGEYLLFLDSDDFFEWNMLEKLYEKALETNADIILFNGDTYNDRKKEFNHDVNHLFMELVPDKQIFSKDDTSFLFQITRAAAWLKLYKKDFISENNIKFSKTKTSNDIYFNYIALASAKKITYVEDKLMHYRVDNNSLQNNLTSENISVIDVLYDAYLELKKRNLYNENIENTFNNAVIKKLNLNIKRLKTNTEKINFCKKLMNHRLYQESFFTNEIDYYTNFEDIRKKAKYLHELIYATKWIDKHVKENYNVNYEIIDSKHNDTTPDISVILPVYNTQKYLKECLDSLVDQTYSNIEIIAVNDGSTDNSLDILKEYLDKSVSFKIITYDDNMGVAYARNIAIKHAKGKYIYLMDSDDTLELNAFELVYQKAIENDLDMLFFNGSLVFESEEAKRVYSEIYASKFIKQNDYSTITTGLELLKRFVKNNEYLVNTYLYLIKRDVIINNGIWFEHGVVHGDNAFTFNCLIAASQTSHTKEILHRRRLYQDSITISTKEFYSIYSYFINYQLMLKTYCSLELKESEKKVLTQLIGNILKNIRSVYIDIDQKEQSIYKFLDDEFNLAFEPLVIDYVRLNKKLIKSEKEVEKIRNQVKNISNDIKSIKNSRSYKIVRKIAELKNYFKITK